MEGGWGVGTNALVASWAALGCGVVGWGGGEGGGLVRGVVSEGGERVGAWSGWEMVEWRVGGGGESKGIREGAKDWGAVHRARSVWG